MKGVLWFATGIVVLVISMLAIFFGRFILQNEDVQLPLVLWISGLFGIGVSFRMLRKGIRATQPDAGDVLTSDHRAPILYLRSFKDDGLKTELPNAMKWNSTFLFMPNPRAEETLIQLNAIGPVVAIGRPGESLPETGAYRLYVSDAEWQEKVLALMTKCRLVIMLGKTTTQGVHWEIEKVVQQLKPDQLIFFFPSSNDKQQTREEHYTAFRNSVQKYFDHPLPLSIGHKSFLCFHDDWKSDWVGMDSSNSKKDIQNSIVWLIDRYAPEAVKTGLWQLFKIAPPVRKFAVIAIGVIFMTLLIALLSWGYIEIKAI